MRGISVCGKIPRKRINIRKKEQKILGGGFLNIVIVNLSSSSNKYSVVRIRISTFHIPYYGSIKKDLFLNLFEWNADRLPLSVFGIIGVIIIAHKVSSE